MVGVVGIVDCAYDNLKQSKTLTRFKMDVAYASEQAKIVSVQFSPLFDTDHDIINRCLVDLLRFVVSSKPRFKVQWSATMVCMVCQSWGLRWKLPHFCVDMPMSSETQRKWVILFPLLADFYWTVSQHEGFFQHPIFSEIFGAQWLKRRGEATGEYAPAFNPVPLQTLSLIATAVSDFFLSMIESQC